MVYGWLIMNNYQLNSLLWLKTLFVIIQLWPIQLVKLIVGFMVNFFDMNKWRRPHCSPGVSSRVNSVNNFRVGSIYGDYRCIFMKLQRSEIEFAGWLQNICHGSGGFVHEFPKEVDPQLGPHSQVSWFMAWFMGMSQSQVIEHPNNQIECYKKTII